MVISTENTLAIERGEWREKDSHDGDWLELGREDKATRETIKKR